MGRGRSNLGMFLSLAMVSPDDHPNLRDRSPPLVTIPHFLFPPLPPRASPHSEFCINGPLYESCLIITEEFKCCEGALLGAVDGFQAGNKAPQVPLIYILIEHLGSQHSVMETLGVFPCSYDVHDHQGYLASIVKLLSLRKRPGLFCSSK